MKLLVAMPSLNQGRFIEAAIVSVARQLEPSDEFVIVDGGSSDNTPDILERYSGVVTAVHVFPGQGQAAAIRWAFDHYDSDICCYLNTDDVLFDGAVQKVKALFRAQPRLSMIYSDRVFVNSDGVVTGLWRLPPHSSYLMSRWDYIPQETAFWRHPSMNRAGGIDADLRFAMDYDLFLGIMAQGGIRHVRDHFGAFRVHEQSKTQRLNDTVGKCEVASVRARHGIRTHTWDRIIGGLLRRSIEGYSSAAFRDREQRRLQKLFDLSTDPSTLPERV